MQLLRFDPRWREELGPYAVTAAQLYAPITAKVIGVFSPVAEHLGKRRQLSLILRVNLTAFVALID
jgi:hypothetical protein